VAVAMVFIHKLDYFQVNYNNHNNAGVTMNMRLQPLEVGCIIRVMNCGFDVSIFDNEAYFGWVLEEYWGPTAVMDDGISIQTRAVAMAQRGGATLERISNLKAELVRLKETKELNIKKAATENRVAAIVAEFKRVHLDTGTVIQN
jgi:hypothetical protein